MNKTIRSAFLPAVLTLGLMLALPTLAPETAPLAGSESAGAASANEANRSGGAGREAAFRIPMNNYCTAESPLDFSLQISNGAAAPAELVLRFYHRDGSEFREEGTTYNGIASTIVPGTPFTLAGNATGLYHINFGNHKPCDERIYLGKIEVRSGQADLLAGGWVQIRRGTEVVREEAVTIHGGQLFTLRNDDKETAE